jgi:hypothetical protein
VVVTRRHEQTTRSRIFERADGYQQRRSASALHYAQVTARLVSVQSAQGE